ncbi:hypothetical protein EVB91_147 [Rhizobium phage RHph_I1_18]|nr:hypothetical protein EVB91_147 [Rhizobium phage RHph_I1_18]
MTSDSGFGKYDDRAVMADALEETLTGAFNEAFPSFSPLIVEALKEVVMNTYNKVSNTTE